MFNLLGKGGAKYLSNLELGDLEFTLGKDWIFVFSSTLWDFLHLRCPSWEIQPFSTFLG